MLSIGDRPGVPAVLIHGFGGDLNSWLFNQDALAMERAVHLIELPGHGGSDLVASGGGVGELAATVGAAMATLELGSAHLIGHSLGGALAIEIARAAPRSARAM